MGQLCVPEVFLDPGTQEQIKNVLSQPLEAAFPALVLLCLPGFPVSMVLQKALMGHAQAQHDGHCLDKS